MEFLKIVNTKRLDVISQMPKATNPLGLKRL